MRQMMGKKKVAQLRERLKLPVVAVSTRGGSHVKELYLEGGRVVRYDPSTGEFEESKTIHHYKDWNS